MLNNDVFIFDNAVHMYDLSDENISRPDGAVDRAYLLNLGDARRRSSGDSICTGNSDNEDSRPFKEH